MSVQSIFVKEHVDVCTPMCDCSPPCFLPSRDHQRMGITRDLSHSQTAFLKGLECAWQELGRFIDRRRSICGAFEFGCGAKGKNFAFVGGHQAVPIACSDFNDEQCAKGQDRQGSGLAGIVAVAQLAVRAIAEGEHSSIERGDEAVVPTPRSGDAMDVPKCSDPLWHEAVLFGSVAQLAGRAVPKRIDPSTCSHDKVMIHSTMN